MNFREYREKAGFFRSYLTLIIVIGLVFYAGYQLSKMGADELRVQNTHLSNSVENLRQENEELKSAYNMLKVELDIAQLANEKSQETSQSGINREMELKEQIAFYQRVLAPEISQDGFVVERMKITPTASDNNFLINLILLQYEDIKAVIKGELAISLHGSLDGKPRTINLVQLQDVPKTSLAFAFKYFQVIETAITLPEGFTPERFEIKTDVFKYRKKQGSYSHSILWSDALIEAE